MALHKDLTGAELHEPKGADEATAGSVYVSNGAGSGTWTNQYGGIKNLNKYWFNNTIPDISAPNGRAFFYVPVQSELTEFSAILDGPIATADAVLSVYINHVLFSGETLTVTAAGSYAGQVFLKWVATSNSIPANSLIEIRTNGGSDNVVKADVTIGLRAL